MDSTCKNLIYLGHIVDLESQATDKNKASHLTFCVKSLNLKNAQEIMHLALRDVMERNKYTLNILTLLHIIRKTLKRKLVQQFTVPFEMQNYLSVYITDQRLQTWIIQQGEVHFFTFIWFHT